ncbi:UNVERIFIED_CONTAM: GNAT family N-acetyltransferase, partial [Campylobacter jejuni]
SDRRFSAAGNARHFAVLVDGQPVSSTDLFSDGRTAQIEDVGTLPEHRGAGHASTVVLKALEDAHAMRHDFIFLVADARDWPKEMY